MPFVIYHKETTLLIAERPSLYDTTYATERAAKAARTRMVKSGKINNVDDYGIAEKYQFHSTIEKMETKINMMSGKEFQQPVNTPLCCDPSSETYWSM